MGRTITKILVADFETATTKTNYYKFYQDTCIYVWNIQELQNDETSALGASIERFFEY